MSAEAIIIIDSSQWSVVVATTTSELLTGLSSYPSLTPGTGMLFDMGSDQSGIAINMDGMAFALDIVFINSSGVVVDIKRNVQPGEDTAFDSAGGLGARYFMEVNAGETADVTIGSTVAISDYAVETSVVDVAAAGVVMAAAMGAVAGVIKGLSNEHHSIHGLERDRLVKTYGSWAVGRAESVCPEDDVVCVEHEAAEFLTKFKAGRWG